MWFVISWKPTLIWLLPSLLLTKTIVIVTIELRLIESSYLILRLRLYFKTLLQGNVSLYGKGIHDSETRNTRHHPSMSIMCITFDARTWKSNTKIIIVLVRLLPIVCNLTYQLKVKRPKYRVYIELVFNRSHEHISNVFTPCRNKLYVVIQLFPRTLN